MSRSTSLRTALSLALCTSLATASVVQAGPPPPPPPPSSGSATAVADQPPDPAAVSAEERLKWAKKLFKEASVAHEAADFYNSVVKFEQAYNFAPDKHIFAYNIGQDAWEMKDCARVKQYLTLFLMKETTNQELRKKAEDLLAKAENNKECVTGGPEPVATTTPANNQPRGPAEESENPLDDQKRRNNNGDDGNDGPKKRGASGLLIGGVVLAVLGAGAAGGGIGTMLAAKNKAASIEKTANVGPTNFAQGTYANSSVSGDQASLKTLNVVTPVLFAVGGAMLVGGIVMIVIDRGNKKKGKGFYARQSGVQLAGVGAAPLPGGGAAGSIALHF
ncbi:MAG: hypothetical protein H0T76_14690 [Nannocystis sp.]|nr:hypothetical protein [Nannocystis sp.]MBA3547728.1 hypothetical protein [Nannocystis sp.]